MLVRKPDHSGKPEPVEASGDSRHLQTRATLPSSMAITYARIVFQIATTRHLPKREANMLQPHPLTSVMQLSITAMACTLAACAVIFTVRSGIDERNARLVELGLRVLMVDPGKDESVEPARLEHADRISALRHRGDAFGVVGAHEKRDLRA